MRVAIHDSFEHIPLERDGWNTLVRRSPTNTVFQTHQWANAWWKTFGDRYKLRYLAIEDSGRLAGFAPLMALPAATGDTLHFLADVNSDYCDFAAEGNRYACLDAVIDFLAHEHRGWDSLVLQNIPEQSPNLAALMTLCTKHGLWPRLSRRFAAPRIRFDAHVPGIRLKYSVRRHCNRMERLGNVEFRVLQSKDELPRMLSTLYEQHIGRYRLKGEHSLFENAHCRLFYAHLAEELLDAGWLHFSELLLDGNTIATHFGFEYDKVLTWYKPAFDSAQRQYSPGTVLLKHLIDYAARHHLDALDFTIGDEPFKDRFSNTVCYNRNLTIYRSRSSVCCHSVRDKAVSAAKQLLNIMRK